MATYANVGHILLKRGNTAVSSAYTGPIGELTLDTDLDTIRVHDGVTAGGVNTLATVATTNALLANAATQSTAITGLQSNAATQAVSINTINANVTAANLTIAGLQSNAAIQAAILDTLTGNAASQSTALDALVANAASQANSLTVLVSNAAGQADSLTVLIANAVAQSQNLDSLFSNAASQAAAINTLTSNAATQATAITVIDANLGTATTNINTLFANAASQASSIDTLVSNAATQATAIDTLSTNAASQATSINAINANLGTATTNITTLFGNASTQTIAINTIDANIGSFYTYANVHFGDSNYGNANVATYLSRGNVTVGNITIQDEYDQQWRFSNGALIWPAGDGTPTGPYIEGSTLMTVYPNNDGEFRIQTYSTTAVGSRQWKFTSEGNLIVPDDATIWSDVDLRLYSEEGNIALGNQNGTWMFDNTGRFTAPGDVYGQYFTVRGGGSPGDEIGSLGYSGNIVTVFGTEGVNIETVGEGGPQWQFGVDGSFTVPGDIKAIGSVGSNGNSLTVQAGETVGGNGGNLTLRSGETLTGNAGDLGIIAGNSTNGSGGNILITAGSTTAGGTGGSVTITAGNNTADAAGNINLVAGTSTSGVDGDISLTTAAGIWAFGQDGNLTLPETGYLQVGTGIVAGFASSPAPSISGFSSISAENFRFQGNGVNILSAVGGSTYSNTNVAAYLTEQNITSANIGAFQTYANATFGTSSYGNANVATYLAANPPTGTYSNTNVASYLTTASITTTGNVTAANFIGNISLVGNVTGTLANVSLVAGAYTWTFDNAGNLTLPGNTFAVNYSNGTTVVLGSGGSDSYSNSNVVALLSSFGSNNISTSGNITGGNLITTGNVTFTNNASQINFNTGAYISGNANSISRDGSIVLSPYTGAGSTFPGVIIGGAGRLLAPNGSVHQIFNTNDVTTQVVSKITAGTSASSTTSGALIVTGGVGISGNVYAGGTATTGIGALVAGVTNTLLANTVAGFTGNVNSYTQVTFQNKNTGADATADFILTADNGSDTVNYGDFGIINSGYDVNTPTNSLGNIVYAADTYIYAQGNISNAAQSGGNLVIGTTTPTKNVKIFAGGTNNSALVANFSNTGMAIAGTLSTTGNISAANFIGGSANVQLVANVSTWTFDTTGNLTLPGNIFSVKYANGTTVSLGGSSYGDSNVATLLSSFGSNNISTSGNITTSDATVNGTSSNLIRRAFGLVAADTYVTLDDLKARVTSSTNQLSLMLTTGSWQGTGWTETFTSGTPAVSNWVNLPLSTGYDSASGAMNSQGNGCRCVISDQTPAAKVYQVTVVRSGTTGNQWNISIERLV